MYVCTHSDHKCQIVQLYHIIINKRRSIQCQSLIKSSLDKFWNDLNSQLHTFAPRNDNPDEIYQNLLNAITYLFRKYCNIKKFNLKHNIVLVFGLPKVLGVVGILCMSCMTKNHILTVMISMIMLF